MTTNKNPTVPSAVTGLEVLSLLEQIKKRNEEIDAELTLLDGREKTNIRTET